MTNATDYAAHVSAANSRLTQAAAGVPANRADLIQIALVQSNLAVAASIRTLADVLHADDLVSETRADVFDGGKP
jgi:hypothetical protein